MSYMKGTYCCTNVKFCMEDENQRRAWEYLHGLSRRDGSYGKVLSDALVAVIDGQNDTKIAMVRGFSDKLHGNSNDELRAFSNEIAGLVLEGIREIFAYKVAFQGVEQIVCEMEVPKLEQEDDIAEDMLDFAFALGE